MTFEAAGSATNAETQQLAVVRYHQAVFRKSNDMQFHDQLGYWMWDAEAKDCQSTHTMLCDPSIDF